jgi:hypothetical protein
MYRLVLKILLSIILLTLIFWNIESKDLFAKISAISLSAVIGALFCLIVQSLLVSGRWRIILAKCSKKLPFLEVIKIHYMSLGASIFLPNMVAEPALKSILTKKYNVSVSSTLLSVVLDKLFVVSGLFVMTLFVMPIILKLYNPGNELILVYGLMVGSICFIYLSFLISRRYILGILYKKYVSRHGMLKNIVNYLLVDRALIISCILITIISQIASTTAFYILSLMMGTSLTYQECLLLITPAQFITTMPITFNGWGIREVSIIYMLSIVNIPTDTALVLSIQYGLIGLLLWSIGLISWALYTPKLSF